MACVKDFKQYEVSIICDGVTVYTVENDILSVFNKLEGYMQCNNVVLQIICKNIQRRQTAEMWLDRLFNYIEHNTAVLTMDKVTYDTVKKKIYAYTELDVRKKDKVIVITCKL